MPNIKNFEHSFNEDFQYSHNNPYHDRLEKFSSFVLRDLEPEKLKGKWNQECFKNDSPLNVEIGTGYGHFMKEFCADHPNENFIGMDYRFKRSFNLAKQLNDLSVKNFRYIRAKAERIEFLFSQAEVDKLYYFFPDPWPKTRHLKKRLFKQPFLSHLKNVMKPTGKVYIKTDHDQYYEWMLNHLELNSELFNIEANSTDIHKSKNQSFDLLKKYQTKFEKIFLSKGKNINGIILTCK